VAILVVVAGGTPPSVSAAVEIVSFETTPGIVRTNLRVKAMDFDPVSGLLYVYGGTDRVSSLLEIDVVTREIVRQAPPLNRATGRAWDLDVSADGRTILVSTAGGVTVVDRASLTQIRHVPTSNFFYVSVHASPSDPDRFLYSEGREYRLVDGERGYGVGGEGLPPETDSSSPRVVDRKVTFGLDDATFYTVEDGEILRYEVADPPVIVDRAPLTRRDDFLTVHGDNLLFGSSVIDPETLAVTTQIPDLRLGPKYDGDGSFVFRRQRGGGQTFVHVDSDDLDELFEWSFPSEDVIVDWVSLPDDRLAVLEPSDIFDISYLTIVDPRRAATGYGEFHALTPSRVLDTRATDDRVRLPGKLSAGETVKVQIAGRGGVPVDGVQAVVMNATVSGPTERSFFSIWPSRTDRPTVSNLNFGDGQALANSVTVAVGADGAVNLSNEFGSAHAVLDVVGYYGNENNERGARYTAVENERIVDTRPNRTPGDRGSTLGTGETRTFQIGEVDRIAELGEGRDLVAVALNVTAVRPSAAGFLTVWPGGEPRPTASSLNFAARDIRANLVVVGVGEDDDVSVYNPFGSVDVLVDIVGVYETFDEPRFDQQGKFLTQRPIRAVDTRISSPFSEPGSLEANTSLTLRNFFGWTDIWNVTAVRPTADGFFSVLPFDPDSPNDTFPTTSNVNFGAGETVANAVYALGDPNTEIYNSFGRTHVVVDLFGYLTPEIQRPVEEVWSTSQKPLAASSLAARPASR